MPSMMAMAQEIEDLKARDEALTAILASYAILVGLGVLAYCFSRMLGMSCADISRALSCTCFGNRGKQPQQKQGEDATSQVATREQP